MSGQWCNKGRHAPHVVPVDEYYYLFFTAHVGDNPQERHIGLAVSERPNGPFTPCTDGPLLSPVADPEAFDSWVLDDPCVIRRNGRYWLYYKGRNRHLSPAETLIGVAFADSIEGPYVRYERNPLFCGHTACAWSHREGVAMFADNPPRSLMYARDGLHFEKTSNIEPPHLQDIGVYAPDALADTDWGNGITWGLALCFQNGREYLARVECDLRPERH